MKLLSFILLAATLSAELLVDHSSPSSSQTKPADRELRRVRRYRKTRTRSRRHRRNYRVPSPLKLYKKMRRRGMGKAVLLSTRFRTRSNTLKPRFLRQERNLRDLSSKPKKAIDVPKKTEKSERVQDIVRKAEQRIQKNVAKQISKFKQEIASKRREFHANLINSKISRKLSKEADVSTNESEPRKLRMKRNKRKAGKHSKRHRKNSKKRSRSNSKRKTRRNSKKNWVI